MNKTKIEWVKNPDGSQGYTWNPITGCLKGCEYCYARRLANGRLKSRYLQNLNIALPHEKEAFGNTFYPRFWPDRMFDIPIKCYEPNKHLGIFVCDMGELFGSWIPKEWTLRVFTRIRALNWHRFYLLTKQPQNLIKFSPFPDNCWVGVSATDFDMFGLAIHYLSKIEAKVKYISFEPLLGRIDINPFPPEKYYKWVNWVIVGAQTKPHKAPELEWVKEITEACDKSNIPVFIKDNLSFEWGVSGSPCFKHLPNGVHKLRQEMPNELLQMVK